MNEDGRWITINGTHVFVKEGQNPMDAFIRQKGKSNYSDEELEDIKDDIKSFKKGKSDVYEDMKPEQFKKILDYLGIKKPNVLNKMERIGYDGTFTTRGNVSIRELKTFGAVLRQVIESKE